MDTALPVDHSAPSPLEPVSVVHADGPVRGVRHRRWRCLPAWRWLPTAFVVALTVAVLGFYGVSGWDMALFGIYVAVGLALPGVLLVRALYGGSHTLAEEIALGLVLGYALEVLVYIAARAVGLPLLV